MAHEGRVLREGVVAGLIGAAAVAVLILVFDIAGGAPMQSPATPVASTPDTCSFSAGT